MTLQYPYRYALGMAYIGPPGNDETFRIFKLRVYNTLHTMAAATTESQGNEDKATKSGQQWMQV